MKLGFKRLNAPAVRSAHVMHHNAVRFCDDDVNPDIVGFSREIEITQLEIVCDTNLGGPAVGQQPVVITLSTTDAVATPVVGHSRNDNQFDIVDIGSLVACRFFYSSIWKAPIARRERS